MKIRLNEIFEEAKQDTYAITMDGDGYESRMVYGVKIVKDKQSGKIEFFNTKVGGDYYKKLNAEQLETFIEKGWRIGVYVLSLSNYRLKLDIIEKRIHKFINDKKSEKQIKLLKASRERILTKYSEINYKLNQLNYGDNEVNYKEEADNI
jgi:hypothetical protein|tara:strand:+ start:6232 stop:6681 length:450 start_codon:yes stop_codon:yes gene_type:complete